MSSNSSSADPPPKFVMWHYNPSIAGAVIYAIVFGILFFGHTYQLVRHKKWFCIPFLLGCIFEVIGYAGRIAAHNNLTENGPYIIQSLLLLLAPILFAASIYMILGRIIRACNANEYSPIRVTRLTKIFVAGDIICFLVQAMGGGQLAGAKTKTKFDTGNDIILGGLIIQIVIFVGFLTVASVFYRRLQYHQTVEAQALPWKKLMLMLFVSSFMVTARNVYRVIEYAMGQNRWLMKREWPLYIFDGLLMIIVATIGLFWYGYGLESVRHGRQDHGAKRRFMRWGRYRSSSATIEEGRGKSTEHVPLQTDASYTGA